MTHNADPQIELKPGYTFVTARRTITEADIVNFAGLSNDFDPLHIDEQFAKDGPFGRRVAHGQMIGAIVTGLRSELGRWPVLSYQGTSRQFRAPVGAGDTVFARYTVASVRVSSSNPERLVVTLDVSVRDQHDTEVQNGQDVLLVSRKEAGK